MRIELFARLCKGKKIWLCKNRKHISTQQGLRKCDIWTPDLKIFSILKLHAGLSTLCCCQLWRFVQWPVGGEASYFWCPVPRVMCAPLPTRIQNTAGVVQPVGIIPWPQCLLGHHQIHLHVVSAANDNLVRNASLGTPDVNLKKRICAKKLGAYFSNLGILRCSDPDSGLLYLGIEPHWSQFLTVQCLRYKSCARKRIAIVSLHVWMTKKLHAHRSLSSSLYCLSRWVQDWCQIWKRVRYLMRSPSPICKEIQPWKPLTLPKLRQRRSVLVCCTLVKWMNTYRNILSNPQLPRMKAWYHNDEFCTDEEPTGSDSLGADVQWFLQNNKSTNWLCLGNPPYQANPSYSTKLGTGSNSKSYIYKHSGGGGGIEQVRSILSVKWSVV